MPSCESGGRHRDAGAVLGATEVATRTAAALGARLRAPDDTLGGQVAPNVVLEPGDFQEIVVGVGQLSGERDVAVQWSQPVTVLHYWSFGRVL